MAQAVCKVGTRGSDHTAALERAIQSTPVLAEGAEAAFDGTGELLSGLMEPGGGDRASSFRSMLHHVAEQHPEYGPGKSAPIPGLGRLLDGGRVFYGHVIPDNVQGGTWGTAVVFSPAQVDDLGQAVAPTIFGVERVPATRKMFDHLQLYIKWQRIRRHGGGVLEHLPQTSSPELRVAVFLLNLLSCARQHFHGDKAKSAQWMRAVVAQPLRACAQAYCQELYEVAMTSFAIADSVDVVLPVFRRLLAVLARSSAVVRKDGLCVPTTGFLTGTGHVLCELDRLFAGRLTPQQMGQTFLSLGVDCPLPVCGMHRQCLRICSTAYLGWISQEPDRARRARILSASPIGALTLAMTSVPQPPTRCASAHPPTRKRPRD